MERLRDYWEVTLDKEGKWHCYHRWSARHYPRLAPSLKANWIIPAPTRGQALTIAKSHWVKQQKEEMKRIGYSHNNLP